MKLYLTRLVPQEGESHTQRERGVGRLQVGGRHAAAAPEQRERDAAEEDPTNEFNLFLLRRFPQFCRERPSDKTVHKSDAQKTGNSYFPCGRFF